MCIPSLPLMATHRQKWSVKTLPWLFWMVASSSKIQWSNSILSGFQLKKMPNSAGGRINGRTSQCPTWSPRKSLHVSRQIVGDASQSHSTVRRPRGAKKARKHLKLGRQFKVACHGFFGGGRFPACWRSVGRCFLTIFWASQNTTRWICRLWSSQGPVFQGCMIYSKSSKWVYHRSQLFPKMWHVTMSENVTIIMTHKTAFPG